MMIRSYIQRIYFLNSLFFLSTSLMQADQNSQIQNIVETLKQLKTVAITPVKTSPVAVVPGSASTTSVTTPPAGQQPAALTPPATPIAASIPFGASWGTPPTDTFVSTGNSLPKNISTLVDVRQNGKALACKGGLQFITVGLIGASRGGGWGCTFNIAASPMLQKLSQQGLYVVVTTYQQANQNIVTVSLTDVSGNIYAQSTLQLPAGQGFSWVNIGYNKNDTWNAVQPNQVYVNWLSLAANVPVVSWYQDQGSATAASTSSIPAATTGVNSQIIPPAIALMAYNLNGTVCSAPFVAVNALTGTAYNSSALSCFGGLQFINIALTDAKVTDWNSSLQISSTVLSQPSIVQLMQKGMYIAINMLQNPAGSAAGNYIQICLTDVSGNIVAQSPLVQLPSGIGFAYANVGFNVYNTEGAMAENQTYVNWMPIAKGQRIFYQDQGTATTVTTPGIGGQASTPPTAVVPGLASTSSVITPSVTTPPAGQQPAGLTPPVPPLTLAASNIGDNCTFTAPGITNSNPSAVNLLSSTPFSCVGGLTQLNVGLTDATGCFLSFNFDTTILSQPVMQSLMNVGMYIGIRTVTGKNAISVLLMDQNNNVYAQGTAMLPAGTGGAISTWNLGLNTGDSNVVNGSSELGYNGISISQTVLYQQLSTVSQPAGAVAAPNTPPPGWRPF